MGNYKSRPSLTCTGIALFDLVSRLSCVFGWAVVCLVGSVLQAAVVAACLELLSLFS